MSIIVVSGGQTGADRAGLDAAIELGLPHRGWCPLGRRAEDGVIPTRYNLQECSSADYSLRTRMNVIDSRLTLIFVVDETLSPGSAKTVALCREYERPYLVLNLRLASDEAAVKKIWSVTRDSVVNVAGTRESKAPGIQAAVKRILLEAFAPFR